MLTVDGCGTNKAAADLLGKQVGLLTPTTRCSSHAAHGSIRRLSSSKTMCVQEVVDYTTHLKPVLKHFKNSGKSLSLLNDALEVLEMKKLHTMTWCPTRMGFLLVASKRAEEMLVPIFDVVNSCTIQQEHKSYFLSPKSLVIMHLLADIEPIFMAKYLKRVDGDKCTIIDSFHETENMVSELDKLEPELFNSLLDGLEEDDAGNVNLRKVVDGTEHLLRLNCPH